MAAALAAGEIVDVADFCRRSGISRKTFYKWRARFAAQGVAGLEPRSRRPLTVANACSAEVEDAVMTARKRLADDGRDCGPETILAELVSAGELEVVPARATIARILTRRGMIVAQPRKRPRSSYIRYQAARPNERWQSDWTQLRLADGSVAAVAATMDDHSRVIVGIGAGAGDGDAELVWSVMAAAIAGYGIPAMSLTDNGWCYSQARWGRSTAFTTNLAALGCVSISSTPRHPQTCGKIERFWQTLKKWLARHGAPFDTIEALNAALTEFAAIYNQQRPHRSLNGATPAHTFAATTPARPAARPLTAAVQLSRHTVTTDGVITVAHYSIGLGRRWAHTTVDTIHDGNHITIFAGSRLVRVLDADPTRRYQPQQPRTSKTTTTPRS